MYTNLKMSHFTPYFAVLFLAISCNCKETTVTTSLDLQSTLNSASPGDTINLATGEYPGPFTITANGSQDSPITLQTTAENVKVSGKDEGIGLSIYGGYWKVKYLHISGFDTGILIRGPTILLESLAVTNVNTGVVVKGINSTVKNCAVEATKIGIHVAEGNNTQLDANALKGSDLSIKADEGTCCGLLTWNVATGHVQLEGMDYNSEGNVMIDNVSGPGGHGHISEQPHSFWGRVSSFFHSIGL